MINRSFVLNPSVPKVVPEGGTWNAYFHFSFGKWTSAREGVELVTREIYPVKDLKVTLLTSLGSEVREMPSGCLLPWESVPSQLNHRIFQVGTKPQGSSRLTDKAVREGVSSLQQTQTLLTFPSTEHCTEITSRNREATPTVRKYQDSKHAIMQVQFKTGVFSSY